VQAVLLTEDVEIIVQHVTGVLLNLAKRHAPKPSPSSSSRTAGGTTYGDQAVSFGMLVCCVLAPPPLELVFDDCVFCALLLLQGFRATVAASMAGFLVEEQAAQFGAQLWCFLHSGLTVKAYDKLDFADAADGEGEEGRGDQEEQDQGGGGGGDEEAEAAGALRDL
jgi:hypothetical protein